jgi:hypothetical protein
MVRQGRVCGTRTNVVFGRRPRMIGRLGRWQPLKLGYSRLVESLLFLACGDRCKSSKRRDCLQEPQNHAWGVFQKLGVCVVSLHSLSTTRAILIIYKSSRPPDLPKRGSKDTGERSLYLSHGGLSASPVPTARSRSRYLSDGRNKLPLLTRFWP